MDNLHQIQTTRDQPVRRKTSVVVMWSALAVFLTSFPLIYLAMALPGGDDVFGVVLYFCGPLPIIPAAVFLVGYVMLLFRR
jgi:hypothetical protein